MKIRRLIMKNFRSVAEGEILFPGHTAIIGGNSVGKSTMCEALDLCLGPDRLSRFNPINEHDFYQRKYLDDNNTPVTIEIEVVLTDLSADLEIKFRTHREYWDTQANALLDEHAIPVSQSLRRISDMHRAANNVTGIKKSDSLLKWAQECDDGNVPKTKCVVALSNLFDLLEDAGFAGSPTEDWLEIRRLLEASNVEDLKKVADNARYLRLLRRGSIIEEQLANLWRTQGSYLGAEDVLEQAILQDQLLDSQKESASISVMNMHQLKGREYDGVLLVENQYQTLRGRDADPPYMETRRLLQVALTRAKHFVLVLSEKRSATLDVIFKEKQGGDADLT